MSLVEIFVIIDSSRLQGSCYWDGYNNDKWEWDVMRWFSSRFGN